MLTCGCLVAAGLGWVTADQSNYVDLQLSVVPEHLSDYTLLKSLLVNVNNDQSLGSADLYGVPFVSKLCFLHYLSICSVFINLEHIHKSAIDI